MIKSEVHSPVLAGLSEKALPTMSSPERREKIAASKREKPRPPHVVEAMRKGRTGKPHDDQARRKMSEAHRRRGTLLPGTQLWTEKEDEAVRTLPPGEAAERTGRTLTAVVQEACPRAARRQGRQ